MHNLLLLSVLVFLAGFIDSIAGGGGLITLPAYLNAGLKTELLLGTNKLSSTFGTLMAAIRYFKELSLRPNYVICLALTAIGGSFLGARAICLLPTYAVKYLLIILIPPTAIFMLLQKKFGIQDLSSNHSRKNIMLKSLAISFLISFYDGFFGPGTGTFFAISFTFFCGYSLIQATALSKILNFSSNISALVAFFILGRLHIELGLLMAFVGIAGNLVGATFALKKGVFVIKPLLFIIANALLVKIIYGMLK